MSRTLALAALLLPLSTALFAAPDPAFDGRAGLPAVDGAAPVPRALPRAVERDDRVWVRVQVSDAAGRTAASRAGVAIESVTPEGVAGVASRKALSRLRKAGLSFTSRALFEEAPSDELRALDFPSQDSAFHNYARMTAALKAIAGNSKGLASVYSIGQSLQGKDLWALRFNSTASGSEASDKPGIVFMGTHHAREHLSTEVPLMLAQYLVDHKDQPGIAKLLATRDIYIIPMVNPDGVEYDIRGGRYHMHRKNLRKNHDGSVGVDLNRNYGYMWGGDGSSSDPDDETYAGPSSFSEPETRAVRSFIEARPNLKILLTYHTFSELILYPWGYANDPLTDGKALAAYKAMADAMGAMTGYTPEQSSALYISAGDTTDWAWGVHKIFSFTFEMTPKDMDGGGFYPGAGVIQTTFQDNLRPALYLIGLADEPLRAANTTTAAAR